MTDRIITQLDEAERKVAQQVYRRAKKQFDSASYFYQNFPIALGLQTGNYEFVGWTEREAFALQLDLANAARMTQAEDA